MTDQAQGSGLLEWRTSWTVVLAAGIGMAVGNMYVHFMSAMVKPLQDAYQWSRGEISLGLTLITILMVGTNITGGLLVDRFGARLVALWGIGAFGIGFSAVGLAGPELWSWYVGCAFLAILSQGVSAIVWTAGVIRHFHYQRGLALAVSMTGSGLIVAVMPTIVVTLVSIVGVKGIFPAVGIIGALLMFIPCFMFFREPATSPLSETTAEVADRTKLPGPTLKETLLDRRFWQVTISMLLIALCLGTFLMHIQPMLIDSGLTPTAAASVAFFIGPSLIFGRLLIGSLFDYLDPRWVAGLAFFLPAVTSILLINLDTGYHVGAAAGIFIGLSVGAEIDVAAYLLSRYFGSRSYGMLFAIVISVYGVGIGLSSMLAGFIYDFTGTYAHFLIALAFSALAAVLLILGIGKPPPRI